MQAFEASYLKVFVCRLRQREQERLPFALTRHQFGFLVHQKRLGVGDGDGLLLFRTNCLSSISPSSSAQTNFGSGEIHTVKSDLPKTVRVRFKLQKQCAFGQQFLVVGDDPNLGLWDPSDGVPLNWSEGHLWTADVDMPCSRMINYKFILKEITGAVSWQPGPDRILETWDTAKMISVSEDWDSPGFQNIELLVVDDQNESSFNDSGLLVAENLNQIGVEEGNDDANNLGMMVAENMNQREREEGEGNGVIKVGVDECTSEHSEEPSMLKVAENMTEELGELDLSMSGRGSGQLSEGQEEETMWRDNRRVAINGSNSLSLKNETRLVMDEGVPVLVPGLTTMPLEEVETEEVKPEANIMVRNTTVVSDEIVEVTTTVNDEIEESNDLIQEKKNIIVEVATTVNDVIEESNDLILEKKSIIAEVATAVDDEIEESNDLIQEKKIIAEVAATVDDEIEESNDLTQEKSNIIAEIATTVDDEIEESTDLIQENNSINVEVTTTVSVNDKIEESTDLVHEKNDIIVEDTTTESDEVEAAATEPEIRISASLHCAETSEMMVMEEKPQLIGEKQMENKFLDMYMQWGRRTLQKFLANLGFMQHS